MEDLVVREAGTGSTVALAALVIWVLISVLKSNAVPINIPPRVRPWLALLLGQAYAVLVVMLQGTPAREAIVQGAVATVLAIGGQELGGSAGPAILGALRKGAPPALLLFLAVSVGCSGATAEVARYAEASRDILAAAEPCLVAQQQQQLEACKADEACLARVSEVWGPIKRSLSVAHDVWCSLAPESEGC
jgi:hypothetical protein